MLQKSINRKEENGQCDCGSSVASTSAGAQSETSKRFKLQFKKRSRHFVDMQIHGIADIFHAETRCLQIFWCVVVLIGVVCAVVMCWFIIRSAAENPTVTEVLYMTPKDVRYPVITICDSSEVGSYFLNGSRLQLDNWTTNAIYFMLTSAPLWFLDAKEVPANKTFSDPSVKTALNLLKSRHSSLNDNIHEDPALLFDYFYQDYGISCEQLFVSCRDSNWRRFNCCAALRPVFNFQHGLCFASDPRKMPNVSAPGLFSNLFLKFRKMPDLWRNPFKAPVKWSVDLALDNGIDQGIWRADKITLIEGHWATAKLDIKHLVTDTKKVPCQKNAQLCYFSQYTFANCMWERTLLLNKEFELTSKCALPMTTLTSKGFEKLPPKTSLTGSKSCPQGVTSTEMLRYCSTGEILDYVFRFAKGRQPDGGEFAGVSYWMNALNLSSTNPCLEPCSRWDYSYSVEEKPEANLADRSSGVTLTFTHSQYPRIREKSTMSFQDYLALIGGTCGLWLGASLITLIQFLVYTFRFLFRTRLTHRESMRLSTVGMAQQNPPSHTQTAWPSD